jgi:hypothetical protein
MNRKRVIHVLSVFGCLIIIYLILCLIDYYGIVEQHIMHDFLRVYVVVAAITIARLSLAKSKNHKEEESKDKQNNK